MSEATDQLNPIAPTMPQLDYLEAQRSFLAALEDIKTQAEPHDLRAIEALANMAAAAMRQADRAYYDLQSHASWPTETVPEHVLAKHAPMIEGTEQPELRVRIAHVHTLKEGWRCNETSVHWTGRGPKPDRYLLRAAMQMAFDDGRDEADRRNHPEVELESDAPTAVAS
jgi:hypothetical protein